MKRLGYQDIQREVKFLQGKILTIVEAALSNETQLKATKDLVNRAFSEQLTQIAQNCFPLLPIKSRERIEEITGMSTEEIEKQAD